MGSDRVSVFEYSDYKAFIRDRLNDPIQGRMGTQSQLAAFLKIHTTRLSQIFRGSIHLTLEQSARVATYFKLNEAEGDYFLVLVQIERSGTQELRSRLERQAKKMRDDGKLLHGKNKREVAFTDQDMAMYYSSWIYTGTRLALGIEDLNTPEKLANRLNISLASVHQVVSFLLEKGFCTEENGFLVSRQASTHLRLSENHPLKIRHHGNWRQKAMQRHEKLGPDDIAFTAAISVSASERAKVKSILKKALDDCFKANQNGERETMLMCLCMDWFEF